MKNKRGVKNHRKEQSTTYSVTKITGHNIDSTTCEETLIKRKGGGKSLKFKKIEFLGENSPKNEKPLRENLKNKKKRKDWKEKAKADL